jgi:5-methyltetrahydrofolate--homocysteine methyltransferase
VNYIDWTYFFTVWGIRGKYPNRSFPKIFNDETIGEEARKLYDDANEMLKEIISNKTLQAKGVYGIFEANSNDDDDIEVYLGDNHLTTFHTLRKQQISEADVPFVAMSDFIAPKSTQYRDYIACFAVTAGIGLEELVQHYTSQHDHYRVVMVKAVGDRLAEAFTEYLHELMRKELWGYASEEDLSVEDLFKYFNY